MHGGDGGGKQYFLLLKLIKHKKAQFWATVSTHFVADCGVIRVTRVTMVTRVIWVTRVTLVTRVTWVTWATTVTLLSRVTWVTKVTEFTWVT